MSLCFKIYFNDLYQVCFLFFKLSVFGNSLELWNYLELFVFFVDCVFLIVLFFFDLVGFVWCLFKLFVFSPHLCVGFLFLVLHSRLRPSSSSSRLLLLLQLAHTQLVHTQLAHTHTICPHTPCSHTSSPHTTCPHTQLDHTQLVTHNLSHTHTTCQHTTCPHTTCPHTTCPHTTSTQLVHTICHTHNLSTHNLSSHNLSTHNFSTHNLSTHNFSTHNLLTHNLSHTQLVNTQLVLTQLVHTQLPHTQPVHTQLVHLHNLSTHNLSTFTLRGRRGTYGMAGVALGDMDLHFAWHFCRAGVALGDIHLHFAWQARHLATSTVTLRGRRGTWWHRPSLCVAGVALMALGWLYWRAWFPDDAVDAAALCVALGDIDVHPAWQAWDLVTSTFVSGGRRCTSGTSGTELVLVARLSTRTLSTQLVTTCPHTTCRHTFVAHANPSPSLFSFPHFRSHFYLSFVSCWKKLTCGVIRSFLFFSVWIFLVFFKVEEQPF